MSQRPGTIPSQSFPIGTTDGRLQAPDGTFAEVSNLIPTEEGGLRSVALPVPWVRLSAGGIPTNASLPVAATPVYGRTKGIHHAVISGEREILLLHTGGQIWVFEGWKKAWRVLIGAATFSPQVVGRLPTVDVVEPPTKFTTTPTGVIITPMNARSYFFDGITCLPLGYEDTPAPPVGMGPDSSSSTFFPDTGQPVLGVNDTGYAVDGLPFHPPTGMNPPFRFGRIGTISTPGNITTLVDEPGNKAQVMGYLEPGRWRCRSRWVDAFGNLSPLSPDSNDVKFQRQPSQTVVETGTDPPYETEWVQAECVLKQVLWDGVMPGPEGTIARILYRTRDLVNSGTAQFFELPVDASVNASAFATLPDNVSQTYPDNIPDAWLGAVPEETDPVQQFRHCAVAFGRAWYANWPGQPGAVQSSLVGRWGTPRAGTTFFPDAAGAEVTGLFSTPGGLLMFTERSTFILDNPDGPPRTLRSSAGCVAPASVAMLRSGLVVWLGHDGFYGFDGDSVRFLFTALREQAKRHNTGRVRAANAVFDPVSGEYRCWVSVDGNTRNNRCYTYDGDAWHTRYDVYATAATSTGTLVLACGYEPESARDGVWVLDAAGDISTATVKTNWLRALSSPDRASVRRAYLVLRETGKSPTTNMLQVNVRRDYRAEVVSSTTTQTYPKVSEKITPTSPLGFWGEDTYDGGKKWRKRSPFRVKLDIAVPAAEVVQIEVTLDRQYEILAFSFEEQPLADSGARDWK